MSQSDDQVTSRFGHAVWLAVFFGWAMLRPSVRSSFRGVLRATGHPAIIVSRVRLFSYVGLLEFFGYEFGVWTPNMTKHTLIWLLGPALVLVANMADAWEEEQFFRSITKGTLAASAVLALVVNFCILSLPADSCCGWNVIHRRAVQILAGSRGRGDSRWVRSPGAAMSIRRRAGGYDKPA